MNGLGQARIRHATSDDVENILSFWATAAEDSHRPADSRDAVAAAILRDPEAVILAIESGRIVGTVIAGWDGWRCHLYRLAVAPDRRRQGIATQLMDAAEQRFLAFGGSRADAMVLDENELAHGAWRSRGYAPQENWSRWVKPLH